MCGVPPSVRGQVNCVDALRIFEYVAEEGVDWCSTKRRPSEVVRGREALPSRATARRLAHVRRSARGSAVPSLPPGLHLSSDGKLSGTPEEEGEADFRLVVADDAPRCAPRLARANPMNADGNRKEIRQTPRSSGWAVRWFIGSSRSPTRTRPHRPDHSPSLLYPQPIARAAHGRTEAPHPSESL